MTKTIVYTRWTASFQSSGDRPRSGRLKMRTWKIQDTNSKNWKMRA